jgi:hypothetical protein
VVAERRLRLARIGTEPQRSDQQGQGLVEFAMVIPFVIVMMMALLELALALGASLGVNRASQGGAHVAASAGNLVGADCLILRSVEEDIAAPNDRANILEVVIERTALAGNHSYGQQVWTRSGSTPCQLSDGSSVLVPYSLIAAGYPESQRCSVLGGCPTLMPARSTVDNIGVTVRYRHDWVTPLNGALDLIASGANPGSGGWTFEQRNIFRVEPTL